MALNETLLKFLPGPVGGLDILLLTIFNCALIVTYCWSMLGNKFKLVLYFTAGVFLFKGFFEQLIDRSLFPDLHSYLPFILGCLTAGLVEAGALLLANRTMIIGIFFGGAVFPLLCLYHPSFFDFTKSLAASLLIIAAAIMISGSLAMLRITHTKPFQAVVSAIAGALGIVHFAGLPDAISIWRLTEIDGFGDLINLMQNNRLYSVVCLSISGLIVQSLLHLIRRQIQSSESTPSEHQSDDRLRVRNTTLKFDPKA